MQGSRRLEHGDSEKVQQLKSGLHLPCGSGMATARAAAANMARARTERIVGDLRDQRFGMSGMVKWR